MSFNWSDKEMEAKNERIAALETELARALDVLYALDYGDSSSGYPSAKEWYGVVRIVRETIGVIESTKLLDGHENPFLNCFACEPKKKTFCAKCNLRQLMNRIGVGDSDEILRGADESTPLNNCAGLGTEW